MCTSSAFEGFEAPKASRKASAAVFGLESLVAFLVFGLSYAVLSSSFLNAALVFLAVVRRLSAAKYRTDKLRL